MPTKKGHLLVHRGYTFWLKNRLQYGKKQWYCSSRQKTGCMAAINTELQRIGDVVKVVRGVHNHDVPGLYRNSDGTFKISFGDT